MNRDIATPTSLVDARHLQDGARVRDLKKHSGVHYGNLQTSVWDQAFEGIAEAAFLSFIILAPGGLHGSPWSSGVELHHSEALLLLSSGQATDQCSWHGCLHTGWRRSACRPDCPT